MKAVIYKGPFSVAVEQVPEPRIEAANDVIVRITTTNICGSDLHMYEGRTSVEEGKVLGHENMGIVEETGPGVSWIKPGDRVSVPFNIACGTCRNCVAGWTSFCLRTNPNKGVDGAAYGYAHMGPYQGGQAEYLRVPFADFNLLPLPPGNDFERDFTMLSDIFPTGYHGAALAGVSPGDTVAVFGAGPVGLLAAHSSYLRAAPRFTGRCRGSKWSSHQGGDEVSFTDKMRNKFKMGKGRAKENAGRASGDRSLRAKGRGERMSGAARQIGEQAKDAGKNVRNAFKS